MKKLFLLLTLGICTLTYSQNRELVTYTYGSDEYLEKCIDVPIVRKISGGTIIHVNYEGNWATDEKGAFEYACKL